MTYKTYKTIVCLTWQSTQHGRPESIAKRVLRFKFSKNSPHDCKRLMGCSCRRMSNSSDCSIGRRSKDKDMLTSRELSRVSLTLSHVVEEVEVASRPEDTSLNDRRPPRQQVQEPKDPLCLTIPRAGVSSLRRGVTESSAKGRPGERSSRA